MANPKTQKEKFTNIELRMRRLFSADTSTMQAPSLSWVHAHQAFTIRKYLGSVTSATLALCYC